MNRAKQRGKKRGNIIDSIKISDTLQNLIDRLSLIRKNSIYVFPTIRGSHYTLSGFKGMWGKIMAEAKEQKIVGAEGFTLPLVSYGGSGIVMNAVAIAMLLRIDYENRILMRGGKL